MRRPRFLALVPKRPRVASPGFELKTKVFLVALLVPSGLVPRHWDTNVQQKRRPFFATFGCCHHLYRCQSDPIFGSGAKATQSDVLPPFVSVPKWPYFFSSGAKATQSDVPRIWTWVATRLCSSARPYHRTVPDGGITAGMGQGQSGLCRIRTHMTRLCSGARPYHRTVPDGGITVGMGRGQSGIRVCSWLLP